MERAKDLLINLQEKPKLWGTIDGAWESGERAAEAALRRIGALKDPEPEARPAKQRRRG